MTFKGYNTKIEYIAELDMFKGEILDRTDSSFFFGKSQKQLRPQFKKSLEAFSKACREKGIQPRRNFSGKFNFRIPTELHEEIAIVAQAEGMRINALAQEALLQRVST
jgi:predicted HicB family RNase H-like nuclease